MPRIATPGTPRMWAGLPSREREPEFLPYGLRGRDGKRGVIDDLLLHPRVGAGVDALRLELSRADIEWVPEDEADERQASFAEGLTRFVRERTTTDATDPGAGWGDVLAWAVDAWVYGFALANWSWTEDLRGRRVLELYPVMPSTVAQWVRDASGYGDEWIAVRQATQFRTVDIPRDRLLHLRVSGAPGEWEGQSILRPLIFTVETWKESARAIVMALAAGSGVIKAMAPAGGSDTQDWQNLEQQLVEFEQGLRRWFMSEAGYDIAIQFPAAGATGGMVEILRYCDSQIDYGLQQSLQSLGFSSHGSRALGSEIGDEGRELRRASMEILLRRLGAPIAALVAEEVGYAGPLPTLTPATERKRELSARVAMLSQAVTSGLLRWTPEREADLAGELDVAGHDEDTAQDEAATLMVGQLNAAVEIASKLRPSEGEPAMSPEVALELLLAAGIPEASARKIVEGASAGPVLSAPPAQLSAGCGCGSCSPVRLAAPAVPGWERRELLPEEAVVEWARNEAIRLDADDRLARSIAQLAAEHRLALWAVLPEEPGVTPPSVDRIREDYEARYGQAIGAYARDLAQEVALQSRGERHRQIQPDGTRSYVLADVDGLERSLGARLAAMAERAAQTIAQRVEGRLVEYWALGGKRDAFESGQTRLHAEAYPIGSLIESEGRVVEAFARAPQDGLIPVAAIRTEVRDNRLCEVCRIYARTVHDLTTAEGVEAFLADELPDPSCEGAPHCRCGWVVRYARVTPEQFAQWQAEVAPVLQGAA